MLALADRWLGRYTRALDMLSGLCLAIMVVLVSGNVVLRYTANSGITVSEELSRWLFVWLTFMGAVVALREHGHLGTDVLVSRLPAAGKKVCLVLAQVAMLYVSWLLLKGSWAQMVINADTEAPVTGASVGIFYASGVLMGGSAIAILLRDLLRTLFVPLSENELVMVQESEELAALQHRAEDASATPPSVGPRR
ncbi:TRAP-type C4-dicarboxylate transport system permease small subunit [Acidovorax delafieldii]|uniref:TRAP transporter small permease protein n=1 Tax=Acidovorax delafieldii TaxID=47920 RepID=A0AAJ2BNC3_ACIDE|nr:TRAP transporter small permease [Acidovorax delafieldii]MDR6764916.1 TRAP-type C4-dicarboxylate transport system permease small subunit [Acidovorax delafieldii]MDR6835353.1 TRAP-type C4-dicarboxylate transport system permease small subunit [Acidovorax delafieldii]MDR7365677.1 TRAP-type C4-dicarboxylate transport system permease small subunit [Acidovorax delafieldii]